jgi:hypothetical protein
MPQQAITFQSYVNNSSGFGRSMQTQQKQSLLGILAFLVSDQVGCKEWGDRYIGAREEPAIESEQLDGVPIFISNQVTHAQASMLMDLLDFINKRAFYNGKGEPSYQGRYESPFVLKPGRGPGTVEIWMKSTPCNALGTHSGQVPLSDDISDRIVEEMCRKILIHADENGALNYPTEDGPTTNGSLVPMRHDETKVILEKLLPALVAFYDSEQQITFGSIPEAKYAHDSRSSGKRAIISVQPPDVFNQLLETELAALKKDQLSRAAGAGYVL